MHLPEYLRRRSTQRYGVHLTVVQIHAALTNVEGPGHLCSLAISTGDGNSDYMTAVDQIGSGLIGDLAVGNSGRYLRTTEKFVGIFLLQDCNHRIYGSEHRNFGHYHPVWRGNGLLHLG